MWRVLDFSPPIVGMEGRFNTFRLGGAWYKRIQRGDEVLLLDTKEKIVFGIAVVVAKDKGTLKQMLSKQAFLNHTQLGKSKRKASVDLHSRILKRYGPKIATDNRLTTVILLRRLK